MSNTRILSVFPLAINFNPCTFFLLHCSKKHFLKVIWRSRKFLKIKIYNLSSFHCFVFQRSQTLVAITPKLFFATPLIEMEFTEITTVPNKNSMTHTYICYLIQSETLNSHKIQITKWIRFMQVFETKVLEPAKMFL